MRPEAPCGGSTVPLDEKPLGKRGHGIREAFADQTIAIGRVPVSSVPLRGHAGRRTHSVEGIADTPRSGLEGGDLFVDALRQAGVPGGSDGVRRA
ncbi:hypothetical protein GCM10027359_16030 [Marilutibacter aestuarii]